jgi:hypothetical protein
VRAVGLGLGAELPHQGAPARLITAADEVGMPLLTVPDTVPFIAVTKAVFAYRARTERQELEWALQTQRALTAASVTPGGLLGILAAHREATGRTGVEQPGQLRDEPSTARIRLGKDPSEEIDDGPAGGAWIPRRTATSCGWRCGPGTPPGCRPTNFALLCEYPGRRIRRR